MATHGAENSTFSIFFYVGEFGKLPIVGVRKNPITVEYYIYYTGCTCTQTKTERFIQNYISSSIFVKSLKSYYNKNDFLNPLVGAPAFTGRWNTFAYYMTVLAPILQ